MPTVAATQVLFRLLWIGIFGDRDQEISHLLTARVGVPIGVERRAEDVVEDLVQLRGLAGANTLPQGLLFRYCPCCRQQDTLHFLPLGSLVTLVDFSPEFVLAAQHFIMQGPDIAANLVHSFRAVLGIELLGVYRQPGQGEFMLEGGMGPGVARAADLGGEEQVGQGRDNVEHGQDLAENTHKRTPGGRRERRGEKRGNTSSRL